MFKDLNNFHNLKNTIQSFEVQVNQVYSVFVLLVQHVYSGKQIFFLFGVGGGEALIINISYPQQTKF